MNTIKTSPLAIWSLVLGIVSFIIPLGPFISIVAIICGHVARAGIRISGGTLKGGGIALAGLTLGYIWTAFAVAISLLWEYGHFFGI